MICDFITESFDNDTFPESLKIANIVPIHKKGSNLDHKNYRPISLLPPISKIFEKVVFKQIATYFENKFSKFLCGFRKGFSTQTALIRLLHNWQKCIDKKGIVGTVFYGPF